MEHKELIKNLKNIRDWNQLSGFEKVVNTLDEAIQALESKEPKPSDAVEFQVTFGNHLKAVIIIDGGKVKAIHAVNGWGDSVPLEDIKIEFLTTKQK